MSKGPNNVLENAAMDADQHMSSSPAGSPSVSCGSPPPQDCVISSDTKHWIVIELIDDGNPVPGEDFRITLPDGSIVEGSLDSHGKATIKGIDAGCCRVAFPNRDAKDWNHA